MNRSSRSRSQVRGNAPINRYGAQDVPDSRIGRAGYGTPGVGYGAPGAGYGAPGAGYGVPGAGYGAPGAGYGAPGGQFIEQYPITEWTEYYIPTVAGVQRPVIYIAAPLEPNALAALGGGQGVGYGNNRGVGYGNNLGGGLGNRLGGGLGNRLGGYGSSRGASYPRYR